MTRQSRAGTPPPTHGTANAYSNHGCRCPLCRAAWTVYNNTVRRKRTARGICIGCDEPRWGAHVRCRRHHEAMLQRSTRRAS